MSTRVMILTDEDCDDIMGTASYGGITYWATDPTDADRALYKHADYVFRDAETVPSRVISLTRGQIRSAYFALTNRGTDYVGKWLADYFTDAHSYGDAETGRPDLGCIDASAADAVVQVAAFGKVIYG